jgi:hypothetical protein
MKFIKERHLRVKTPITVDGLVLAYDSFQRPRYSITHLPITAKVHLEKANRKLPVHLKKIIEVIDPIESPEPVTAMPMLPDDGAIFGTDPKPKPPKK